MSDLVTARVAGNSHGAALSASYRWVQKHWASSADIADFMTSIITEGSPPIEKLRRVRDLLSPGMSNLAAIFGVSRQTIYNWLNGEQPRREHISKLEDLVQATDIISRAGIPITGALLKRPVLNGKSLLETAQIGGSAQEAARRLVQLVSREVEQRQRLAERFAGRKVISPPPEADFPAENDIE
ncbi:helix-turn-helix domain-containing protein [Gloeobacter kilaueensis]|uniref:helix-turn-helix domain-containing protein n=1 Tax=Gloeobacter kilaueensis TaxID=1416614 RepID=UPI001650E8A9|nr:helix-turn-helix domain-containing protein [Gloeobacter kilaueensis]